MEIDLIGFAYLFLRLAPFVLASFFTLASVLNQDFKGIIYLVGLLLCSFITTLISKSLPAGIGVDSENRPEICNMLTFGQSDMDASGLPLGQSTIAYTFMYLLFAILKYDLVKNNTPTLIFFPLLLAFDFLWNYRNSCYSYMQLLISLFVGASVGSIWAYIISTTKTPQLIYFSSAKNQVCSKPTKSTFRCNVYKNGKVISKL
jgi:hypothetical protein|tara:strand:- start:330 stop:938 length:609 start_codon:yes stop_codon:yes gene_type:complete